jgi:hypothetical protein
MAHQKVVFLQDRTELTGTESLKAPTACGAS